MHLEGDTYSSSFLYEKGELYKQIVVLYQIVTSKIFMCNLSIVMLFDCNHPPLLHDNLFKILRV